jgi:hypothetical protein
MSDVTGSDHNLVTCQLHTGDIIRNFYVSARKRRDKPCTIYDYKSTSNNDWENYRSASDNIFTSDNLLNNLLSKCSHSQQDIDVMWKCIISNTQKIAIDNIPHKQIKYRNPRKPRKLLDLRPSGLLAHVNALRKLSKEIHQFGTVPFTSSELSFYNNMIDTANAEATTNIPHVDNINLRSWPALCRPHIKCMKKQFKIQALQAKEEAINKRLISRAEDTISNQSRMLSSLLDKDFKKITVDRLVTTDENNVPTLHTNPDDILSLAPKQYSALLRPRNHGFDNLPDEWKEIYNPLQHFPDNIYDELLLEPTHGEWHEAMKKCSLNTAQEYLE